MKPRAIPSAGHFLLLALFCCCFFQAAAQKHQGWLVEPTFHYGKLLKHTPKLRFDVNEKSYAFELEFKRQMLGKKPWQEMQGYPMLGFSAMYYYMGKPDTLGEAFSIAPTLSVYVLRRPKWNMQFLFGYGLAYLNRTFDLVHNPINNAIGSNVNVTVKLRFDGNYRIADQWWLKTGFSFTHYSNGAAQLPNLGLNIPAFQFGFRYAPVSWSEDSFVKTEGLVKQPDKRFGLDLNLGLGLRERGAVGGPRSPIYLLSVGGLYHTSRFNRVMFGGEYEFNRGIYLFGKHVGEFETEQEALRRSMRWMLFVGDELQYGGFSISMQVGLYLHKVYLGIFPFYNRFTVRYFLPSRRETDRFYVGVQLKSHLIIAEYFSLSGGMRF